MTQHEENTRKGPATAEPGVAIVTGGSRGIGLAIVESLLEEGWTVHFCSHKEASVNDALGKLEAFAGRVHGQAFDAGDQQAVDRFVETVEEREGRVDCLVNNAGIGLFAPVDQLSGDDWRRLIATNVNGPFYFVHAVAPGMRRRGSGWIFNIASLASRNPFAGGAAYNASKFALLGFSEAAMLDLRGDGIRVAAILPGSVDTDFHADRDTSTGWMLHPEDIAQVVSDLLRYPDRALPSRVEIRPRQTSKS